MALSEIDQNSRFEKSLGLLTTRFVNLLQEADDGVLDLKVVSILLYLYELKTVQGSVKLILKINLYRQQIH